MSVYFNKKDELKEKAVSHYKMMEAGFKDEIEECVKIQKLMAVTELQLRRQQKGKMSLTWLVIPKQQKLQSRLSLWTSLIP